MAPGWALDGTQPSMMGLGVAAGQRDGRPAAAGDPWSANSSKRCYFREVNLLGDMCSVESAPLLAGCLQTAEKEKKKKQNTTTKSFQMRYSGE